MAERLKIYACSGLGATESAQRLSWWSDGTDTINNTQAVNALLVKINLYRIQLQRLQLSQEERCELLNAIMLYSVCLYFVRKYDGYYKSLETAGKAIGTQYENGAFANPSLTLDNAEEVYNQIIAAVNETIENGEHTTPSAEFIKWWQEHIVKHNTFGLNRVQRERLAKGVKGIGKADEGWQQDKDISEYLLNASEYFMYLYFTDKQLRNLPAAFKDKADQQALTYDYCKDVFVGLYGTEDDLQDVIRAGITNYFGHTPEEVCDKIAKGEKVNGANGVGELVWTIEAIVAIVSAVLSFIGTIVMALVSYAAKAREAEYAAIDQAAINASVPSPEDYEGLDFSGLKKDSSSWITIAAIGLGALLLLKH